MQHTQRRQMTAGEALYVGLADRAKTRTPTEPRVWPNLTPADRTMWELCAAGIEVLMERLEAQQ